MKRFSTTVEPGKPTDVEPIDEPDGGFLVLACPQVGVGRQRRHFTFLLRRCREQEKFQLFVETIERQYLDAIEGMVIPQEPRAQKYLMKNWYKFRKIGRLITKSGYSFKTVWKAYEQYNSPSNLKAEKLHKIVKLTQWIYGC